MKPKIIFFGNGMLAEAALEVLQKNFEIVFHAKTKEDLETVKEIKNEELNNSENDSEHKIYGVLASYGVIIKQDVLDLFEPEGIINLHPSKLPDLRGPSPIETAIVRGDTNFTISIMKLVRKMDAGPIYYQENFEFNKFVQKSEIYRTLASAGSEWISKNLLNLPEPFLQDERDATFSSFLDKTMSELKPAEKTASRLYNEVRAYQGFPKSRIQISGVDCIIIDAHESREVEEIKGHKELSIKCSDGNYLVIDSLQPAGKKPMDAKAFVNGYLR